MGRRRTLLGGASTFEEERKEAIESALCGVREKPGDNVTRSACAYLLNHLIREVPESAMRVLSSSA